MHIHNVLQQLGYPPSQVKIYLASLRMGESSLADLAEQVEMPRTSVAELIREMHKHGLLNYYTKKNRKLWFAENPEKLLTALEERRAALKNIMPILQGMRYTTDGATPSIRLYTGTEEVKNIFDDIIDTRHHMLALVSWDDIQEYFGEDFMSNFIERRYTNFLKIRLITPKTDLAKRLKERDNKELRKTRFLPEQINLRRVSNFIYNGKVAMISLNRKEPIGIIIEDPDVVYAQTIYFESLWDHSSEQ